MALFGPFSNTASATTLLDLASLANKILYLDAHTTFAAAAHADPVTSWTDLSGNNYHQVGAGGARPQVQKTSNTSPSGEELVRWDGVDDGLESATPAQWPSIAAGYTLYWYGRFPTAGATGLLWSSDNTGRPQIGIGSNGRPFVRTEAAGTTVFDLHSASIFDTKMQMLAVVFKTDNTVQAYRAISSGAVTALDQNPAWGITPNTYAGISTGFHAFGGNLFMTMDLAVELWVGAAHDLTTIGNVRDAMKAVYGED